jgi:hypothetical protein
MDGHLDIRLHIYVRRLISRHLYTDRKTDASKEVCIKQVFYLCQSTTGHECVLVGLHNS